MFMKEIINATFNNSQYVFLSHSKDDKEIIYSIFFTIRKDAKHIFLML